MLISRLLSVSPKLQKCAVDHAFHFAIGSKGADVTLIQQALVVIGNYVIAEAERKQCLYGPSTAKAVLAFKTQRQIVNLTYQTKPDDIVGKMTIVALDAEVLKAENSIDYENFNSSRNAKYC
jgi:peptidoglycan hydrolase-like protein with peptidoglycan-binding domain